MTARPNIILHQSSSRSRHQPKSSSATSLLSISRTSSGPGTPRHGRGDIPRRKSSTSIRHLSPSTPQPQQSMVDQLITATPGKPGRRRKLRGTETRSSEQRQLHNAADVVPSSEDEEALLDLLGVQSPQPISTINHTPARGVLPISRSDIQGSKGRAGRKGRTDVESEPEAERRLATELKEVASPSPRLRAANRSTAALLDREVLSEGDALRVNGKSADASTNTKKAGRGGRGGRKQKEALAEGDSPAPVPQPRTTPSGISARRPLSHPTAKRTNATPSLSKTKDPFETESLNRSLPADEILGSTSSVNGANRKGKQAGNEDESAVWEMPDGAGPTAAQELTWQQRLESTLASDSPRRSKQASANDRKAKTRSVAGPPTPTSRNPRPTHERRASLDTVPTVPVSTPISTVQTRSYSAFNESDPQPWYTSFNASRTPQTPVKIATARPVQPGTALPLINGDFPRLNKGPVAALSGSFGTEKGGSMYAGPTFHNSPSAASLPKPDMDDF